MLPIHDIAAEHVGTKRADHAKAQFINQMQRVKRVNKRIGCNQVGLNARGFAAQNAKLPFAAIRVPKQFMNRMQFANIAAQHTG